MTIEDELRATLHQRASEVPAEAVTRMTSIDYRPRTRPQLIRKPVALGLTGTAAAASAAGAAIALLGGAAPAFAGWSPTPTPPSPGQLQQAASDCQQQIPMQGLPLKLSDTRGPFTFQIYADAQSQETCINGPSFTNVSGMSSSAPITTPPDELDLTSEHATSRGGDAFTFALGRAGANVTGASFDLANGTHVQATLQNGWFVAWWPGGLDAPTATLSTTDGTKTQTFRAPKCPLQVCAGGTTTGSSTSGTSTSTSGTSTSGTSTSETSTSGTSTSTSTSTTGTPPGHGAVMTYGSSSGGGRQSGGLTFNTVSVK